MMHTFIAQHPDLFAYGLLPVFIFAARVADVTLGTFRIIFISRGMKYFSVVVGFFEILIWLLAIGQIFKNLSNIYCYLAYAGGFASGSFLGVYIAEKMAMGKVVLRILTARDAARLIERLKVEHYGITTLDAQGADGPVQLIFSIVQKKGFELYHRSDSAVQPQRVFLG